MFLVWVLTALLLFILYHIPIKTSFKYEKLGSADELSIRNWVIHPALGVSLKFSILELEELKSPERLFEALLGVVRSHLGIGKGDARQDVSSKQDQEAPRDSGTVEDLRDSGGEEDENRRLIRRVIHKYRAIVQAIRGFLEREPSKVPAIHVGGFIKDMFVGTMLRMTPRCKALEWDTDIGVGDAAGTAIAVGMAWSFVGMVMSGVRRHFIFVDTMPSIKVNPRFDEVVLDTTFHCIFESRFGHIMIAGFRTLLSIIAAYIRGGE